MDETLNNCDCVICKNNKEVEIPEELINDMLSGNVTIFAGAGISTESPNVLNISFYETIQNKLGLYPCDLDFPDLMEKYCEQPNGRFKLLKQIKKRLDTVDSFRELNFSATNFHRELGALFFIKNIITTNWDTFFERYCKATPFVTDQDLAFWESAERRVLKIHGSVSNLGSIVATLSDYKECKERLDAGIIGSFLKTILATQTVIFIGYSLSDSDFCEIYDFVKNQMQSMHKQAYIVTPYADEADDLRKNGLIPIITDGTYFISQIKIHMVNMGVLLDDSIFEYALDLLYDVKDEHSNLHKTIKLSEYPQLIYAASYQDGIIHSLERALEMRYSGQYTHTCKLQNMIESYLTIQKEMLSNGIYENVAYIEGYVNALAFLLLNEDERKDIHIPLYYCFGCKHDIFSLDEYKEQITSYPDAHKSSNKRSINNMKKLSNPDSIEFHHPPWL